MPTTAVRRWLAGGWLAVMALSLACAAPSSTSGPAPAGGPVGQSSGGGAVPAVPAGQPTVMPARQSAPGVASSPAAAASPVTGAASSAGPPQRGGAVTVSLFQEPATLNPLFSAQDVVSVVLDPIVEGLLNVSPDGTYVPVLAAEVPTTQNGGVSADGKTITYKLKRGVTWHDGQPFTSADVKFTWEARMNRANRVASRAGYDQIESVETPDESTVVVKYKEFYAPYLGLFGAILPKHLLGDLPDVNNADYNRAPIGTGPFKFKEWVSASHTIVERNPTFREAGKPYLDQIIFKYVPSPDVAVEQIKAGQADVMWSLSEDQTPELQQAPGVQVLMSESASVERLMLNLSKPGQPADPSVPHPILGDLKVRQALQAATPIEDLITQLFTGGLATRANAILTLGFAADKNAKPVPYDLELAKRLLEEAGWKIGPTGIREKDGQKLQLTIVSTPEKRRELTEQLIQERWRQIGVQLDIRNSPSNVVLATWKDNGIRARGNFDIIEFSASTGLDPHAHLYTRFHSSQIPSEANGGAGFNFNRLQDPDIDKWLDEAAKTPDTEQRAAFYRQVSERLNSHVANIWLYARTGKDAARSNVVGPTASPWNYITFNVEDWWVKK